GGGALRVGQRAEPATLDAANLEAAPGLAALFAERGLTLSAAPASELAQRVRERRVPVAIQVVADPNDPRFTEVRVVYDQTNVRYAGTAARAIGAIQDYSRERGRVMLTEVGV